jgi:hypothetical protein
MHSTAAKEETLQPIEDFEKDSGRQAVPQAPIAFELLATTSTSDMPFWNRLG